MKCTEGLNPIGVGIVAIGLFSVILFTVLFLGIFVVSCQKSEKWHDEQKQIQWDKIVAGQLTEVDSDSERILHHNPYDMVIKVMMCLVLGGFIGLYIISPTFRMIVNGLILLHFALKAAGAVKKHYGL